MIKIEYSAEQNEAGRAQLLILGKQLDQFVEIFNTAVHSKLSRDQITKAFFSLDFARL